mgnify:CR=1 FL=1
MVGLCNSTARLECVLHFAEMQGSEIADVIPVVFTKLSKCFQMLCLSGSTKIEILER